MDLATLQVLEEYLDDFPGVLVVVSHDRWFCDRVLAPPAPTDDPDEAVDLRPSSLFVFEGDGQVSQYRGGSYSDYFTALKARGDDGMGAVPTGLTERITGFASPPPLPPPAEAAATSGSSLSPSVPKAKGSKGSDGGGGKDASVDLSAVANIGLAARPLPPPPPPPKAPAPSGPSQRQQAKKLQEQAASSKQKSKVKVSKRDRKEYETIEAECEALEVAFAKAETALAEANAAPRRPSTNVLLELAGAVSAARREADAKMDRFMELEELISMADAE